MENKISNFSQTEIDLMRPAKLNLKFHVWMGFLTLALGVCVYAYYRQLQTGLGVTGMRDFVSWGMYIANFVFFVAASLVGMLISSVLGLLEKKWIIPIARIAEIIAVAFAMVAGLVIIIDMGRPDRLLNVFIHGRIQSPIIWDVTVVTTYVMISLLLLYIPLIPDAALQKSNQMYPKWQRKFYKLISIGWANKPEQYKLIKKSIRILLILIVPVALAIHTVTSWLFAATMRFGWNSTIFGPYFVTGAFVTGVAVVIIAMYFFRNNYKLKNYITHKQFDNMGKLLVLVSLVYLYFNINEFLVPALKTTAGERLHLEELFAGHWAGLFWFTQIPGLMLPILLLLFKPMRKPAPLLIISLFVFVGAWIKRYLIVIPTMLHPHLPMQNVSQEYTSYQPTLTEITITAGTFILVLMIITVLSKLFPVVSIWETKHEE